MDKRTDINNASFAYGINLLRMLLDMNLITQDEYEKITRISAEYYDTEVVCVGNLNSQIYEKYCWMYSNSCGIVCVAKRQISKAAPCGKEKEQMKTIS